MPGSVGSAPTKSHGHRFRIHGITGGGEVGCAGHPLTRAYAFDLHAKDVQYRVCTDARGRPACGGPSQMLIGQEGQFSSEPTHRDRHVRTAELAQHGEMAAPQKLTHASFASHLGEQEKPKVSVMYRAASDRRRRRSIVEGPSGLFIVTSHQDRWFSVNARKRRWRRDDVDAQRNVDLNEHLTCRLLSIPPCHGNARAPGFGIA